MNSALLLLATLAVSLTPPVQAKAEDVKLVALCVRVDNEARLAVWHSTATHEYSIQTAGDLSLENALVSVAPETIHITNRGWGEDIVIPRGKSQVEINYQTFNCDY